MNTAQALGEKAEKWSPAPWDIFVQECETREDAKRELCQQVDLTPEFSGKLYLLNADGLCPATTGCGATSEANARLIAAAPDLYEALDEAILYLDAINKDEAARALLSKWTAALTRARGEQQP